jgi:hypothetical protein
MKIINASLMCNGRDEGLSYELRRCAEVYLECGINRGTVETIRNAGFIPDILFLQIQSDNIDGVSTPELFIPLIKELRNKGCKVINWNGDIRGGFPQWMAQMGANVTAFANMRDVRQCNGKFLQIGIDPVNFKKWDVKQTQDVVFMGNNYGNQFPLGQFRQEACRSLRRKFDAKLYGKYEGSVGDLNVPDSKRVFEFQSAESKVYSGCAVAVSISHFHVERYTSDRLFRCMASGAFTLVHHYPSIEKDFEIGKHLDTFQSIPEMEEKVRYWLDHEEERSEIAEAGYIHVHENFTYKNMAQNILKL